MRPDYYWEDINGIENCEKTAKGAEARVRFSNEIIHIGPICLHPEQKGASERAEPYQSVARLIGLNYSGQVRVSGNGVDNVLEIVTYGRSGQFIGGRYFRQEEYC